MVNYVSSKLLNEVRPALYIFLSNSVVNTTSVVVAYLRRRLPGLGHPVVGRPGVLRVPSFLSCPPVQMPRGQRPSAHGSTKGRVVACRLPHRASGC